ncbi:hypothetical protein VM1G_11941 [Cytospora mali]|uniref:N-acetyltransferase domain-containing protein n=1 Tax=Cytospora mali TaxID=578113 RepID=A0A194WBU0_CYTMA|nr:hypothetical protein VM1G_11941 [Valsa mali]
MVGTGTERALVYLDYGHSGGKSSTRARKYVPTLLAHMQYLARETGRPIWLEATTESSRELYMKHGFTLVGDVELVNGRRSAEEGPRGGGGITI